MRRIPTIERFPRTLRGVVPIAQIAQAPSLTILITSVELFEQFALLRLHLDLVPDHPVVTAHATIPYRTLWPNLVMTVQDDTGQRYDLWRSAGGGSDASYHLTAMLAPSVPHGTHVVSVTIAAVQWDWSGPHQEQPDPPFLIDAGPWTFTIDLRDEKEATKIDVFTSPS